MQSGRVDPDKVDAAAKHGDKKLRNRPAPADELRDWENDAQQRAHARPYPPGIMLEPAGFDEEHWTAPHNDESLWTLQLADAFGTRSHSVISTFLRQLETLCQPSHWDEDTRQWRLDEHQFNAALAVVNSVKPRNEMEAALAAQMVAIHLLSMKVSARALKYDYDTRTAATAAKLARAFTQQLETLQSLRGEKRTAHQTITVSKESHQHIHYHDHRGENENEGQPHERNASRTSEIADDSETLRSQDESRDALPLPRSKGKI